MPSTESAAVTATREVGDEDEPAPARFVLFGDDAVAVIEEVESLRELEVYFARYAGSACAAAVATVSSSRAASVDERPQFVSLSPLKSVALLPALASVSFKLQCEVARPPVARLVHLRKIEWRARQHTGNKVRFTFEGERSLKSKR